MLIGSGNILINIGHNRDWRERESFRRRKTVDDVERRAIARQLKHLAADRIAAIKKAIGRFNNTVCAATILGKTLQHLPAGAILMNSPDHTLHSKRILAEGAVNVAIASLKSRRPILPAVHDRRR